MNRYINFSAPVIVGLALFLSLSALAQFDFDPMQDVGLKVVTKPEKIKPGGTGEFIVRLELPENVHITHSEFGFFYIEMDETDSIKWLEPIFPKRVTHDGDEVYRGNVRLTVPFEIDKNLQAGDQINVTGAVGYQICTEVEPIYCSPPVDRPFTGTITIGSASADSDAEDAKSTGVIEDRSGGSIENRAMRALESGSWLALLWIFLGGVALSFTPCVYPIIPITIAFIGGRSGGNKLKGLSLSLVFVLGLGIVYSILGVVAAATGDVFGLSAQNPWVIGFVTIVFLAMGAGMLGAFEMSLPSSFQSKLASQKRSGYLGALFVGGTTGLVAAPCVGPVLVALLSWVSSTGSLFLGFIYLFVFAMGLGLLFVVIGTFAGALTVLPKAGGWMENVKKVFGVVLIAAAFYFGKPMLPEKIYTLLTGLALLMLAGMLGAFTKLAEDSGLGKKFGRAVSVFVLIAGIFYTLLGFLRFEGMESIIGGNIYNASLANEKSEALSSDEHSSINWIKDDVDAAFQLAQETNKPVMIDFWAEWCAACKELDHKTFSQPEIYKFVNRDFIALKIDGTEITDEVKQVWKKFGVKGLPTVVFMDPDGKEIDRFEAFRTVEEVLPFLQKASK